ncbi:PQQ-dependent sugar dehydrogenase, partial [bacterium]|nr:PQQ-dependent sugar dehydrogenase [bacterium]
MKRTFLTAGLVLFVIFSFMACGGGSSRTSGSITLERAFPSLTFTHPISMNQPPGDDTRWFLIEKGGQVLMFSNDDAAAAVSFSADLSSMVDDTSEGGLLGMAFHPSFSGSGHVYLYFTETGSSTPLVSRLTRYTMNISGTIDTGSGYDILSVDQPDTNHNGGDIKFGPDGYLYIALGDGGGSGDTYGNGQDTTTLLGSMLRIDVDGGSPYVIPAGNIFASSFTDMPEIYAWGLRNPWRFSFDELTGDLLVGDVGQGAWEEIDLVVSGGNYGWNIEEGAHCYPPSTVCDDTGLIDPVFEYGRAEGWSVTGGYVYRGSSMPAFQGHYLFADWGSGKLWAFDVSSISSEAVLLADTGMKPVSFAQDQDLELYVLDYS